LVSGIGQTLTACALLVGGLVLIVQLMMPGIGHAIVGHFLYDVLCAVVRGIWKVFTFPLRLLISILRRCFLLLRSRL